VGAPFLAAGIEESRELASLRVESGDVRAFVEIVVGAGEGEVFVGRLAPMLLGDDVIDGEGELGDVSGNLAIFTAIPGSFPDAPLQRFVHGSRFLSGFLEGKDRLSLQDREDVIRLDVRLEILPLLGGDPPRLLFREQLEHSLLVVLHDAQVEDESGPFGRQIPSFRLQGTAQEGGTGHPRSSDVGLHRFCS